MKLPEVFAFMKNRVAVQILKVLALWSSLVLAGFVIAKTFF